MDGSLPLSAAFVRQLSPDRRVAPSAELEATLHACWLAGRTRWGESIDLPADALAGHLASVLGDQDPLRFLPQAAAADLYLACACARDDESAIQALDTGYLSKLPRVSARHGITPAFADDVRQVLRQRLLMGTPGKIAQYRGECPLSGWLQVAAARTAANLRRKKDPQPTADVEALAAHVLPRGHGLDVEVIRVHLGEHLKDAFHAALATLPAELRNVVRWRLMEHRSSAEIARLLNVHERTITRWVSTAVRKLKRQTRRELCARLRLSDSEFDSIVGFLGSGLDVNALLSGASA